MRTLDGRIQVLATQHRSCTEIGDPKALRERIDVDMAGLIARHDDTATRVVERGKVQLVRNGGRFRRLVAELRDHELPLRTAVDALVSRTLLRSPGHCLPRTLSVEALAHA